MNKQLVNISDDRGTICIAQVGAEIPYEVDRVFYQRESLAHLIDYAAFTIVMIRGSLSISIEDDILKINEDQAKTFVDKGECIIQSLSEDALYITISHTSFESKDQTVKDFVRQTTIENCILKHNDDGCIEYNTFMNQVQRIFYLKNIKNGKERGGHAHKYCQQGLIALDGSFQVSLEDGLSEKDIRLENSEDILFIPPYIFAKESHFDNNSVCLVLASHRYDRSSYIDDITSLKDIKNEVYW